MPFAPMLRCKTVGNRKRIGGTGVLLGETENWTGVNGGYNKFYLYPEVCFILYLFSEADTMRKRKSSHLQTQNGTVDQNNSKSKSSTKASSSKSSVSSLPQSTKATIVIVIIIIASLSVIFQDKIIKLIANQIPDDLITGQSQSQKIDSQQKHHNIKMPSSANNKKLWKIDRKSVLDLTSDHFEAEYRFKKPLIVTFPNGASDWTDPKKWTVSSLKKEYGDWSVLSGNSRDIVRGGGSGDKESSFTEFVDRGIKEKDLLGEPLYIFDRHFYQDSNDSIFFLGSSGSGVSFHKHADAWNGVIYGQKRWFLYPVQQTPPGGVYPGYTQNEWFDQVYPHLNETTKPIECVQEAGEILYLPEGMYHGTVNLGDTVAIGIQKKLAQTKEEQLFYEDLDVMRKIGRSDPSSDEYKSLKNRRKEIYLNLLELLPGNSEVKMKIGELYSNYGQTNDGIKYTQEATDIDSFFIGDHKNAEECYKTALKLSPNLWDVHAAYGDFLVDTDRPKEAIEFYKKKFVFYNKREIKFCVIVILKKFYILFSLRKKVYVIVILKKFYIPYFCLRNKACLIVIIKNFYRNL
ncbi:hypothetical protein KUTeg_020610 [Tegillarca granosa]|uniref:JmjC domain-containing protein n=1 Tax=Tegillarca granosa TaxID=220873 RepID=A0ABQ9E8E8_TEGGR|nr:hypothetical protein KUTeg_020610 [Tegillarca granosa]